MENYLKIINSGQFEKIDKTLENLAILKKNLKENLEILENLKILENLEILEIKNFEIYENLEVLENSEMFEILENFGKLENLNTLGHWKIGSHPYVSTSNKLVFFPSIFSLRMNMHIKIQTILTYQFQYRATYSSTSARLYFILP